MLLDGLLPRRAHSIDHRADRQRRPRQEVRRNADAERVLTLEQHLHHRDRVQSEPSGSEGQRGVEGDAAVAGVKNRVDLLGDVRQASSLDNALMTNGKAARRVIPPPIYAMACIVLGALLERARPVPLGLSRFAAHFAGGLLLFLAAGLLAVWAVVVMTRHRTTVEPGRVPTTLVSSGPFRFSRNPIYLAFVLMCASIGVIIDSAWLPVTAALLLLLLDRLVIAREEVVIAAEFGEEYAAYRRRVRRWL